MRKKMLYGILVGLMCLGLVGCGNKKKDDKKENTTAGVTSEEGFIGEPASVDASGNDTASEDSEDKYNVIYVDGVAYSLPYECSIMKQSSSFKDNFEGSDGSMTYKCPHGGELGQSEGVYIREKISDSGLVKKIYSTSIAIFDMDTLELKNCDIFNCDCIKLYGDIGFGSTEADVIAAWGEPEIEGMYDYCFEKFDVEFDFSTYHGEKLVTGFSIRWH